MDNAFLKPLLHKGCRYGLPYIKEGAFYIKKEVFFYIKMVSKARNISMISHPKSSEHNTAHYQM